MLIANHMRQIRWIGELRSSNLIRSLVVWCLVWVVAGSSAFIISLLFQLLCFRLHNLLNSDTKFINLSLFLIGFTSYWDQALVITGLVEKSRVGGICANGTFIWIDHLDRPVAGGFSEHCRLWEGGIRIAWFFHDRLEWNIVTWQRLPLLGSSSTCATSSSCRMKILALNTHICLRELPRFLSINNRWQIQLSTLSLTLTSKLLFESQFDMIKHGLTCTWLPLPKGSNGTHLSLSTSLHLIQSTLAILARSLTSLPTWWLFWVV